MAVISNAVCSHIYGLNGLAKVSHIEPHLSSRGYHVQSEGYVHVYVCYGTGEPGTSWEHILAYGARDDGCCPNGLVHLINLLLPISKVAAFTMIYEALKLKGPGRNEQISD